MTALTAPTTTTDSQEDEGRYAAPTAPAPTRTNALATPGRIIGRTTCRKGEPVARATSTGIAPSTTIRPRSNPLAAPTGPDQSPRSTPAPSPTTPPMRVTVDLPRNPRHASTT